MRLGSNSGCGGMEQHKRRMVTMRSVVIMTSISVMRNLFRKTHKRNYADQNHPGNDNHYTRCNGIDTEQETMRTIIATTMTEEKEGVMFVRVWAHLVSMSCEKIEPPKPLDACSLVA